jgi:transcriptional regulator with XRE-family HTH domain
VESKSVLGKFIQKKRKLKGLTQRDFAEKLYVTESAVSKWERGLSYPDITLLIPICNILDITEHELITASEDTHLHNMEKLERIWLIMRKIWLSFWIISYSITTFTCLISNIISTRNLSWFWIVFTSLLLSSTITVLPFFIEKHKALVTLCSINITFVMLLISITIYTKTFYWLPITIFSTLFGETLIFLPIILRNIPLPKPFSRHKSLIYFTVNTILLFTMIFIIFLSIGKIDVFINKSLPILLISLPIVWGNLMIWRYTKLNRFIKKGITFFIISIYICGINPCLNFILNDHKISVNSLYSGNNYANFIIAIILFIIGVIMIFAGLIRTVKRRENSK